MRSAGSSRVPAPGPVQITLSGSGSLPQGRSARFWPIAALIARSDPIRLALVQRVGDV